MTSVDVLVEPSERTVDSAARARSFSVSRASWVALSNVAITAIQIALLLLVVRSFHLMPAAWGVLKLTAIGFVVNALLPLRFRTAFVIGLAATAIVQIFGFVGGAQLIIAGLIMIAIAHAPIAWGVRVALILAFGGALAAGRAGMIALPIGQAVWPILGSIFMFRMVIYLYDIKHDRKLASWSGALSYFFMLPNPVFPFFPVVDYKTFRRSYYDTDAAKIYQTGVAWMVRGLVQLILYRFVYYYLTISPEEVQTSGQLLRFVVSNYGLYLRVSGTFHFVIGMLHLFGFNLPLSNNFYFLASSFTDYWRRVNIYWKDFMLKIFYYPSYFSLRRFGPTAALVLATIVVFFATTVLHSYQWFWLRGDWYMSPMDVAFWTVLAVMVIANVLWEAKKGRKRALGTAKWTFAESAGRIGRTIFTFAVIASLWSLWSAPSLREWLAMWSVWNVGAPISAKVAMLLVVAVAMVLLGDYLRSHTRTGARLAALQQKGSLTGSPYAVAAMLLTMLILGDARVRARFDSTLLLVVEDLQQERLNRADQGQLERGYYENLFSVAQTNPELAQRYAQDTTNWVSLWRTAAVRNTDDLRRLELLPSVKMVYKGQPFTTNVWGMRDRERALVPAPGTYRVAVLGASTTMGSGVKDNETYPYLLEERFHADGQSVEFLNFAVESYNAIEQVAVVDQRVGTFKPNALLYIAHETEFEKTMAGLATFVDQRTDLMYEDLKAVVQQAGIAPGAPRTIALRRLNAHRDEVIGWAYRHIAEQARAQGITPVWAFVPMPVPGTGPCPPGAAQLFCFGNLSRAGAAADATDPRVQRLFRLARDAGFVTLDLSDVYGDRDLMTLWIAATDGHPNALGHKIIADGLFDALRTNGEVANDVVRNTTK